MRKQITKEQADVLTGLGFAIYYYMDNPKPGMEAVTQTVPSFKRKSPRVNPTIPGRYKLCLNAHGWEGDTFSVTYQVYMAVYEHFKADLKASETRDKLTQMAAKKLGLTFQQTRASVSELLHRKKVLSVAVDQKV